MSYLRLKPGRHATMLLLMVEVENHPESSTTMIGHSSNGRAMSMLKFRKKWFESVGSHLVGSRHDDPQSATIRGNA